MRLLTKLAALGLLLYAAPSRAHDVVYRGATVVDGLGGPPRPGVSIVTRGERILRIVDARWSPPADATVVDVTGLYAAPGLINTHEHFATDPDRPMAEAMLKKDLYGGITSVRDMAGDARLLADLKRQARTGEFPDRTSTTRP